jgi:hypothetical protein
LQDRSSREAAHFDLHANRHDPLPVKAKRLSFEAKRLRDATLREPSSTERQRFETDRK